MRDGAPECRLRLGDRVRWRVDGKEENLIGTVRGLKRKFPRSPDLAVDEVLIWFDTRVHLIEGMSGFREIWAPSEHVADASQ